MSGLEKIFSTFFNWEIIFATMFELITVGLPNTLILTVMSGAIGIVVGIVLAMFLMSARRALRIPSRIYVDVFRGLPHILTIYLLGQGLPLAGIKLFGDSTFGYAAFAIGVLEAAYMAEIFRSGFQSVDKGVLEASRSLGVSHLRTMLYVVIPIGARRVLPALTGQFILILKATSLVYILGLIVHERDLYAIALNASVNSANLSPLVAAGIVYLALTVPMTYVVNAWKNRLESGKPITALPEPARAEV